MIIYLGTDHAGFALKEHLAHFLKARGHEVVDCGAYTLEPEDDYPDFIGVVAQKVSENPDSAKGIIIGGSGQGEAIAANRHAHVRAAVYYGGPTDIVKLSREHNNANILSLGARFLTETEAEAVVALWLTTAFSNDERHVRRLAKLG